MTFLFSKNTLFHELVSYSVFLSLCNILHDLLNLTDQYIGPTYMYIPECAWRHWFEQAAWTSVHIVHVKTVPSHRCMDWYAYVKEVLKIQIWKKKSLNQSLVWLEPKPPKNIVGRCAWAYSKTLSMRSTHTHGHDKKYVTEGVSSK